MVGELITLPLRVGVRVTQLWLRVAGDAAEVTVKLAVRTLNRDRDRPPSYVPPTRYPQPERGTATRVQTDPPVTVLARAEDRPLPQLREVPAHVSEEPELVEERSAPGAEDGAGPEIHVQEPWKGYKQANAREVIARLATADSATLAAVQLYEGGHKRRQTILAAVERQLRSTNGSGSPTRERNR